MARDAWREVSQGQDFVADEMEPDKAWAAHRFIEVAFDGFPDIGAQFGYGWSLGVDAISERTGRVSAVDFVLSYFKDDFGCGGHGIFPLRKAGAG